MLCHVFVPTKILKMLDCEDVVFCKKAKSKHATLFIPCSISDTQIHIRSGLSLALIVYSLPFLSVPAGICVRVCVCMWCLCVSALAPGGHD